MSKPKKNLCLIKKTNITQWFNIYVLFISEYNEVFASHCELEGMNPALLTTHSRISAFLQPLTQTRYPDYTISNKVIILISCHCNNNINKTTGPNALHSVLGPMLLAIYSSVAPWIIWWALYQLFSPNPALKVSSIMFWGMPSWKHT